MNSIPKEKIFRTLAILLILISALILAEFRRKRELPDKRDVLRAWPNFIAEDVSGREIRGSDYSKGIRYVQFVGLADNNNIDLLESVYSLWANRSDIFVVFKNYDLAKKQIDGRFPGAVIIHDQDGDLFKLFGSTKYGKHFVFNRDGEVAFSADNNVRYEKGVKKSLQLVVDNKQFRISEFLQEGKNIRGDPLFRQIPEAIDRRGCEYLIVSMISSFCESCNSGPLIELLKRLDFESTWRDSILLILSREHSEADVEVLKSQLHVDFPTIIAGSELDKKWKELGSVYTENDVNNLVFVVDRSGKVTRVLDSQCKNCGKSFWRWIANRSSD